MAKTKTLDWQAFTRQGRVIETAKITMNQAILDGFALIVASAPLAWLAHPDVVYAADTMDGLHFSSDASWADYVIPLIRHQALPLALTMIGWASLEMILRHPASAMDRAKWAVLGLVGLNFALPFVENLGRHFGGA
ncbi:MAG: hypothetical protein OWS03_02815 [Alicyclobacillaceae bacterium]|nr:hypothetical protein [Alicyclobacillaceae bacterium]